MAKAILVLDMPGSCFGCHFCHINSSCGKDRCQAFEVSRAVNSETYEKPDWCPLRELPEKKERRIGEHGERMFRAGFNACLNEIMRQGMSDSVD